MSSIWKGYSPIFTLIPNFRSSPERKSTAYGPKKAVRAFVIFMSEKPGDGTCNRGNATD
jgi:hypothetical protein